jgi:cation diffusion facilitator CzcD-associated flavoprotein CzcO
VSPSRDLRVVVVGAGMSGILAAITLEEAGVDDVVVYEKADRLGGTWRENTYPGLSCDIPSHFYSYSFALNPEWSRRFAPGAEIQAYFEDVARRWGVERRIRHGREVRRCVFERGRWRLAFADGAADEADVVFAATGVLHHPAYPDIEGLGTFGGACFHSARWDHDVPLAGRRVGVIGTGSSAIQIVTAIVDRVGELRLFQRTPQWIAPAANPAYTEEEKAAFRRDPAAMAAVRAEVSRAITDGFANVLVDVTSPMLEAIHAACVAHLEERVRDPVLREKLRPAYRAACKRLIVSDGFYAAIQRPNATLVTEGIARIEPDGVRTRDGRLHPLDVLVLATGFRVDRFVRPIEVVGRDGTALDDVWADGPFAYLAVSVPDFPNFFLLNGPNGPVGNFSLIEVAELQMGYLLQLVEPLRSGAWAEASASHAATARFDTERRIAARTTIWNSGCKSWYLDASGLPTAWPWTFDRFRDEMRRPRLDDFDLR